MRPRRQKHGRYKAGLGSPKLCAVLVQIDCEKRAVIGADIMTRLVVFVHADSLLANAVHLMLRHKISALPVLDDAMKRKIVDGDLHGALSILPPANVFVAQTPLAVFGGTGRG